MQLGNYEDAIAIAPKVSMKYWQQCVQAYESKLSQAVNEESGGESLKSVSDPLEELVDYNILLADYERASTVLDTAGQSKDSLLVKAVELGNGYSHQTPLDRHEPNKTFYPTEEVKTVHDLGPFDKDLATFTNLQAQKKFE